MAIITHLLLFGCCLTQIARAKNYNIFNYDSGPGLYYENIGEANIYLKDFNLITYYDLKRYFTNYNDVRKYTSQVEQLTKRVQFTLSDDLIGLMKQTIRNLEHKHQLIVDIVGNNTVTSHRKKRFFGAFLGVVGLIFGGVQQASQARQTSALAAQVNQYREEVSHLNQMLKHQMYVFQNFQKEVNERFNKLAKNINYLSTKLQLLEAFATALKRKTDLLALVQYTSSLIQLFSAEQSDLLDCLILARQGALHPMIISPNMLKEKLLEASNRLHYDPPMAKILITAAKNANGVFNMLKPIIFVVDQTIIFSFDVPLIVESYYDIYKLTPAPVHISGNVYAYVYPEKPYLFVDKDGSRHFFMDKQELDECKIAGEKEYLCKRIKPLRIRKQTCEHSLISTYEIMPQNCDVKLIKIDQTLFLELERDGSWLFVAPKPETLYLFCDNNLERTPFNGTGIINVNYTCHNTETDLIILRDYSTNNLNLSHYYQIYFPRGNLREYLQGVETTYLSSVMNLMILSRYEIEKLKNFGSSLTTVQKDSQLYRLSSAQAHNIVLYLTTILCTILLCTNIYLYYSIRKFL